MDEQHDESTGTPDPIERDLARLTLRAPSDALDSRVAALLASSAPSPVAAAAQPVAMPQVTRVTDGPSIIGRIVRVGFAVAACLVVGVTVFLTSGPDQPAHDPHAPSAPHADAASQNDAARIAPVRYDQTITDTVPGEVVIVDNRLPVVPIQQNAIQRTRWVDPDTNTQIEMTVPRQQTLIVPVRVD